MVILRTRNKITDFLMILAWAGPFNVFDISRFKKKLVWVRGAGGARRVVVAHALLERVSCTVERVWKTFAHIS